MSYPTDNPIRDGILSNLRSTLLLIQAGATYRSSVKSVEFVAHNSEEFATFPSIGIGPASYRMSDSQYRRISVDMSLTLMLVVHSSTDPAKAARDLFEDVSLALRADVTRGGYAIDTHVLSDNPQAPGIGDPVFGTEVEINILYRHQDNDPAAPL